MGLDQWLYEVRKLTREDRQRVDKLSYTDLLSEDDLLVMEAEDDARTKAIEDMSYVITKDVEEWDIDKIKHDFDIPDDWQVMVTGRVDGYYHWSFYPPDNHTDLGRTVIASQMKNERDYVVVKPRTIRVVKAREIAYWRKAYDLADTLTELCPCPLENCGYYELTSQMQQAILRHEKRSGVTNALTAKDLKSTKTRRIVYHEWY